MGSGVPIGGRYGVWGPYRGIYGVRGSLGGLHPTATVSATVTMSAQVLNRAFSPALENPKSPEFTQFQLEFQEKVMGSGLWGGPIKGLGAVGSVGRPYRGVGGCGAIL